MWEQQPHFDMYNTSQIEEVVESHIIQVADTIVPAEDEGQEFLHNIFKVFAAKKTKPSKVSELSALPPPVQVIPPLSMQVPPVPVPFSPTCNIATSATLKIFDL